MRVAAVCEGLDGAGYEGVLWSLSRQISSARRCTSPCHCAGGGAGRGGAGERDVGERTWLVTAEGGDGGNQLLARPGGARHGILAASLAKRMEILSRGTRKSVARG